MKKIRTILAKVAGLIQPEYIIKYSDELPEIIRDNTIYIVGDSKEPWVIAFNCPCRCKKVIQLNLLQDVTPSWKYSVTKKGKITISPSIWRTVGCKSHFFI